MVSLKVRSDIEDINQFSSGYTPTNTLTTSSSVTKSPCTQEKTQIKITIKFKKETVFLYWLKFIFKTTKP